MGGGAGILTQLTHPPEKHESGRIQETTHPSREQPAHHVFIGAATPGQKVTLGIYDAGTGLNTSPSTTTIANASYTTNASSTQSNSLNRDLGGINNRTAGLKQTWTQLGGLTKTTSAKTLVPESSTALLVLFGISLGAMRRQRNRTSG